MTSIVIIGDVGGWADHLSAAMAPFLDDADAIVIQVGDLIHRGPDSTGVLRLVRQQLEGSPRRWIQLIGNHESQYLGGEMFWRERLADDDADLLGAWWSKEWLRVAAAVRTADGEEFLVTHAGLTVHSTIVDFRRRTWLCGERIRLRSAVDWEARHTFTRINTSQFIGVDPKHGRDGAPRWSPLVLRDATLLA